MTKRTKYTQGDWQDIVTIDVENKSRFLQSLSSFRESLLNDVKAQDAFESSPKASLIRYESRLWQSSNSDIKDILARLESAPRGTRLMMLDYILLCNNDEGDCFKDDGEQPNVFVAFANVAAVYNAGAITNGLVYRQAGAFLWVAAVAVSVTFAKGHGSSLADSHLRPVTLEFSSRYMQGSFHQYLKTLGYGPSRERMAVRQLLATDSNPVITFETMQFNAKHDDKKISIVIRSPQSGCKAISIIEAEIL
ncbi:hypothetical protein [Mobiluncus mulieris]|uniref:hypothetical protein n=1 Tax=Mobiluncus mulieris TaxID=2052 RepID=UPI00242D27BC|nr:hypothetical protein [Mobiluncus mulieris]